MGGPLAGLKVVELAGLGPAPFAGMMLSDAGADVIRIDRPSRAHETAAAAALSVALERGRRSIALNLRRPAAVDVALALVRRADVLLEGYRPGVAERLGVGPKACHAVNPRLVYARMTGWGQDGPLSGDVGHDINYVALAGALGAIGQAGGAPTIPLNLVGDFGGGGMLLAFGVLAGVLHARATGEGQVVDAAMVDGVATLMAPYFPTGWGPRGTNVIDGGSHFYNVYETSDGQHVSIGALEPQFYAALLERLGLDAAHLPPQMDEASWPRMRELFASLFGARSQAYWVEHMAGHDVCFAPVLSLSEVGEHPHMVARGVFGEVGGVLQPMPSPRFARTPSEPPTPRPVIGEHDAEILAELGLQEHEVEDLRRTGVIT